METTLRFRGFSFTIGGNMVAGIEILEKDSWEPNYLNIPIFLAPGEEPTEERILGIIKEQYERMQAYKQPFESFQKKYRGKEIILYSEEQVAPWA